MTTTEFAAEIRKSLKAKGWSSRDVSVRSSYFANGSDISITIKNSNLPINLVNEIARPAESIRRDEYSGEILSGGNRYLNVSYSRDAMRVICDRNLDAVRAAVEKIEIGSNSLERVEGTEFLVGRPDSWTVTVWGDSGHLGRCNGVEGASELIGTLALNRLVA